MKQKQKGAISLMVVVGLVLLALGGGTVYYFWLAKHPKKETKTEIGKSVPSQSQSTEVPQREERSSGPSTPTPVIDELADWQKYNNEKYHYKVKYPADWYFIKEGYSPPPPASIKLFNISNPYPSAGVEYLSVGIGIDQALGRTLDNYEEIASLKSQYYQLDRLTIGSETAVKLSVPDPNSSEPISVYIQHKDYIYRIVWSDNTDKFVENRKLFEKVLQSFTFTDI